MSQAPKEGGQEREAQEVPKLDSCAGLRPCPGDSYWPKYLATASSIPVPLGALGPVEWGRWSVTAIHKGMW